MKKRLASLALIATTAFGALALSIGSLAWFIAKQFTNDKFKDIDGTAMSAYFAYGDGTSGDPYGIKTPRQLYNLAWLQYNGTFNKDKNNDGTLDKQYYFVLDPSLQSTGLDMTGWVLPPIGTEDYPFLGNFEGNNVSINNLTVSNKSDLEKPRGIDYNTQPEIVGFFGVVGDLNTDIAYETSVNTLTNFTLNDFTVESKTSETLIGLAAGYVNADINSIKINGSATLDVNGQVSTAKTAITDKLSDYGLVGYSTKTASSGSYSQAISTWYDNNDSAYGGTDLPAPGGGSLDVKKLYERLESINSTALANDTHGIRKQTQSIDSSGNYSAIQTNPVAGTEYLHNYEDNANYVGSYCFSDNADYSPGSYNVLALTGQRNVQREISDYRNSETFVFINNSYDSFRSLSPVNNSTTNVQTYNRTAWSDNPPASEGWLFTDTAFNPGTHNDLGCVYTIHEGERYYLYVSSFNNSIRARQIISNTVPTASNYQWHISSLNLTATKNGVTYNVYNMYTTYNGKTYYLRSSNALTTTGTGGVNRFVFRKLSYPEVSYTASDIYDNNDTYTPLITEDNSYTAADNNTGYIVSSSGYEPNSAMKSSGMIQCSWYDRSGSHTYNYDITDTAANQIRTINGGSDVLANSVSSYDVYSEKYEDFAPLVNKSNTGSKFFSMRFNETRETVNANNCAVIPRGKLNGQTFTNYEYPRNTVSFSLGARGQTIFFAGTFIGDAGDYTSFFSLHKVNRTGAAVTSTEEIYQIYKHKTEANASYIYKTSASSPTIPSNYELVFDTAWITNPTSIQTDKIYYFEIPLNGGDYALGPVPNKKGAHLMYLDIGTNGAVAADSITGYSITTNTNANSYPFGVDFAVINVGNNGGDSICVSIASGEKGLITLAITSQNINITNNKDQNNDPLTSYTYQGSNFSNETATGKFTVSGNSPNAMPPSAVRSERKIYVDVVLYTGTTYKVLITDTIVNSAVTSSTYSIDGVAKADFAAVNAEIPSFTSTIMAAFRGLGKSITLTRSGSGADFNATPAFQVSNRNVCVITLDVSGVYVMASDITDYTFYKNSIDPSNQMTNGNTYQF